jgi:uncharacterized membrane protein
MLVLILGLLIFHGVHSVRMLAPGFRKAQLAANEGRWKGIYTLLSLVGFVLIIWGWIIYRPQAPEIYAPPAWGRYAAAILVWLGLVAIASAYQPAGCIKATLKHPFLIGVILWSAGHLLANGDLAGLLVFGSFLIYGIWNRVAVAGRGEPEPVFTTYRGDIIALVAGTALYALLVLWLHGLLFGVSPLG